MMADSEKMDITLFDLKTFSLGRGTLREKKMVLNQTLENVIQNKKAIQNCKEAVRKFFLKLIVLGEVRSRRVEMRTNRIGVVSPTSRINEQQQNLLQKYCNDDEERKQVELDFVKKNTVLAKKHRKYDMLKRELLISIREQAITESKRRRAVIESQKRDRAL
jgi:hypothetical protein